MRTALFICLALVITAGCDSARPAPADPAGAATTQRSGPPGTGEVLETMNAGGYTYVRVRSTAGEYWAAGPQVQVTAGATVSLSEGFPMPGYHSKTLDRTFDVVYFVNSIRPLVAVTEDEHLAAVHGGVTKPKAAGVGPIEALDGGRSVEEIVNGPAGFAGKDVAVRGQVVKFNAAIMNRNWLHIQDGSGADLTVTTQDSAAVGDVVVVRGKVAVDKDFGGGYRYPVIVEEARVQKE